MTFYSPCLVDSLREFVFESNWEKIDQKALKSKSTSAENDEEVLAKLEKVLTSQGDLIECYASAEELRHDMKRYKNAHRVSTNDQKNRTYSEKLSVFDLIYQISDGPLNENTLLEMPFAAIRARLQVQLDGVYEFVPSTQLQQVVETFGKAIQTQPKGKLAVSAWTIDKVYEQFANLYDRTQDQSTLAELKERLTSVAKQRPVKKNVGWYSTAFKQHVLYLEALKTTVEAHPMTFKPYSKTKKLVKTQPAVIRLIHDETAKFVFRQDVETMLTIAIRNKGQKKANRPPRCEEEKSERERGFYRTMSHSDFLECLKSMEIDPINDISVIEQHGVRQVGPIGSSIVSPFGTPCKSALHVFDELLAGLVFGLDVFNRIDSLKVADFQEILEKSIDECFLPACTPYDFIDITAAETFSRKVVTGVEKLFNENAKGSFEKIKPGVGFKVTDLWKVIELRKINQFYPEIEAYVKPAFLEIRRKKSNDFLKQSDMVSAVQKCLSRVIYKRLPKHFNVPESDGLPLPGPSDAPRTPKDPSEVPRVRHYSEFVTETLEFAQMGENPSQTHRVLRHSKNEERFLTNKTAMLYVLLNLWDRVFASHDMPKLRTLEDVVVDVEDLQMFYVLERELILLIDQLEIKYREALNEKKGNCGKCEDACKSLFRIFEEEISGMLLNLETCMRAEPNRDIVIRTLSLARLDTNERTCVFAVELFEVLEILIRQEKETITAADLELYKEKRDQWSCEDHWNIVTLPDVLDLLSQLSINSARLHFVPDIRDLCHTIMRPFTRCEKHFLATVESPKYTMCSSVKRIHSGAVLATVPELKDVLETISDGMDLSTQITDDLVRSARANCLMKSYINIGPNSNSTVNMESVPSADQIQCIENPTPKELLEIAVEVEKTYRLQLNFLSFAFKDDFEVKKLMAEEITFGIFENFKDLQSFEEWVKSDFAMPKSGNKDSVLEWMKLSVENGKIRKIPSVETESEPVNAEEVAPEESPENSKKKSKKAKKAAAPSDETKKPTDRVAQLLAQLKEMCAKSDTEEKKKTVDSLVNIITEVATKVCVPPDDSQEVAKLKRELSNTYAELLTVQEKYDASQKVIKDKKWEKEFAALQKTLTEKEKRIGELEDHIELCRNDLKDEAERRKEELERKDVEIQRLKDRLEQKEQYYKRKIDSVAQLTAERDRLEAQNENRTADEVDDELMIRKLKVEREVLINKNRELNRRVVEMAAKPSASNETAIKLIRDGIEKLSTPTVTTVRNRGISSKLAEFEEIKKRLEKDKLIGNAIRLCAAYVSAGENTPLAKEAKEKLDEYRKTFHGFKSALNANLRMIEDDVTTRLEELQPMPDYPKPFVLNLPPPMPKAPSPEVDRDCPICFDVMESNTTQCQVCHRQYHADCVSQWLVQNAICPLCRSPLPDPAEFPPLR